MADYRPLVLINGAIKEIPTGDFVVPAVIHETLVADSSTVDITFDSESDSAVLTVPAALTGGSIVSFTVIPIETTETSLDDFSLNGVTFALENIIDGVSFDIRATAVNNATGTYSIFYKIIYIQ